MNDIKTEQRVAAESQGKLSRRARLERLRLPLLIAGPALVVLGILYVVIFGGRYVSTDDAYVAAGRTAVSSSVPGRIVAIEVHENEAVRKGDLLFILDDSDYRTTVERAQAELAAAKLYVEALRASYEQSLARLDNAQASADYAAREKTREENLYKSGIASRQDFDKASHEYDLAELDVASAKQDVAKALADLGGNPDVKDEDHPRVAQAMAQLDKAKLDLAHTRVVADADGIVTKVEQVQVGSYANASQPLFWLVSNDRWVDANFKENQLKNLKVGERATVTVDAFAGKKFDACVASFSPGTGSSFSLLPPENATGNWVKVSQRLPVRIDILGDAQTVNLAAGLSASVKVDTRSRILACGSRDAP